MLAFGPLNEAPVRLSCPIPLFQTNSVWKLVPPGLAYMSPSSTPGFGLESMSGGQVAVSSTRMDNGGPLPVQVAPLSELDMLGSPGSSEPCQKRLVGTDRALKTAQYFVPAVSVEGLP